MDAFNDPAVEEVVACTSAQVAKTTILENVVAYHMVHSPAPVMVVMPTLEMAEAFSKDRLSPMLRDTPALRGKVVDTGSRKAGNTLLHKKFPGGHITICGANSEASLSSRPIKIVLGDEVDRWETTSEGDPKGLVRKRTTAYFDAKVGWFSTPKLAGGPIESMYEASDRGKFWIPCPAGCDQQFVLRFAHLKWEEGQAAPASDGRRVRFAERAWWVSPCCEREFDDLAKDRAIRRGIWRSEQPFRGRKVPLIAARALRGDAELGERALRLLRGGAGGIGEGLGEDPGGGGEPAEVNPGDLRLCLKLLGAPDGDSERVGEIDALLGRGPGSRNHVEQLLRDDADANGNARGN